MDESSQAAVILLTEISEPSRPLKRKISHQSTPAFSAFLRTPPGSGNGGGFLNRYFFNLISSLNFFFVLKV
jgi:hypothetical protein